VELAKEIRREAPFRMSVSDVFRHQQVGVVLCGKVLSGALLPKDQVLITPLGHVSTVKQIMRLGIDAKVARVGDNVEVGIGGNVDPSVEQALGAGQFLCDPASPLVLAKKIKAQIVTLNYESSIPLLKGTEVVFFTQNNSVEATICKLMSVTVESEGKRSERENPRAIGQKQTAMVQILLSKPVCVERFKKNKTLGRFALRREDETVAVGVAVKLYAEGHHSLKKYERINGDVKSPMTS
jgi:translation elongation factor EF-1alpha